MSYNPLCATTILILALTSAAPPSAAQGPAISLYPEFRRVVVHLLVETAHAPMGGAVVVHATAMTRRDSPAAGVSLWPYVNGKQWGVPATSDAAGHAVFLLPLPGPGPNVIQVAVHPPAPTQDARWIWSSQVSDGQVLYIQERFALDTVPRTAILLMTCDDVFQAILNGKPVASGTNFQKVQSVDGLQQDLHTGQNVLSVECRNGTGPAGLLGQLSLSGPTGVTVLATHSDWRVFAARPAGWPGAADGGERAVELASPGQGVWGSSITGWPGIASTEEFPVGTPLQDNWATSNAVTVHVERRTFRTASETNQLIGMEWEPWFTPLNCNWGTAEAVPLVGHYDSFSPDVIRQHCLWMVDAGVDFLLVDWSNNLWGKAHWSERDPGVDQLTRTTMATLDVYAAMRDEGIPVPKMVLLLGLDNGPSTTITAMNEQMDWIYQKMVLNPTWRGLFLNYLGKPLVVILNSGGPGARQGQPDIDQSHFTVRWMSTQLQNNHLENQGYWSWMDGVISPLVTRFNGKAEAMTVTPAFFGDGGWTYPQARSRRNGATYVQQFAAAMRAHPTFLLINQWNEFAGQAIGAGYGPKHDQFVDCYSVPLSDDIEPTAIGVPAYRSTGGWGFQYLNLTRALVDLYREQPTQDTVLAIARPEPGASVKGPQITVEWAAAGKLPKSFRVLLDGNIVATAKPDAQPDADGPNDWKVSIPNVPPGPHRITINAVGSTSRYILTAEHVETPLPQPVPTTARVEFQVNP